MRLRHPPSWQDGRSTVRAAIARILILRPSYDVYVGVDVDVVEHDNGDDDGNHDDDGDYQFD